MSEPVVLAFDTSAAHCAAALLTADGIVSRAEAMGRGQAEHLIPMLEHLLSSQSLGFPDITRIGVGIGPGNFTGVRISVAAARGLALGLGIPAIGISGLEALRFGGDHPIAAIAGPRETAYVQIGDTPPAILALHDVPDDAVWLTQATSLVEAMARLAKSAHPGKPPAPMYLRDADAAPARDAPPVILK